MAPCRGRVAAAGAGVCCADADVDEAPATAAAPAAAGVVLVELFEGGTDPGGLAMRLVSLREEGVLVAGVRSAEALVASDVVGAADAGDAPALAGGPRIGVWKLLVVEASCMGSWCDAMPPPRWAWCHGCAVRWSAEAAEVEGELPAKAPPALPPGVEEASRRWLLRTCSSA